MSTSSRTKIHARPETAGICIWIDELSFEISRDQGRLGVSASGVRFLMSARDVLVAEVMLELIPSCS